MLNPNFGRSRHRAFIGESNYDSLRVEFDKRFGAGLQLQSGYTFSKNMDDGASITGSTDFTSEQGSARHYTMREYALSPMDVTHNFTFTAMYAIPEFAQGLTGMLLGGWRVNGLLRLSSGAPFSVATGFDRQRSVEGAQYPNLAAGASNNPVQPGNYLQYFDPAAFELQPAGFLGNLGRNTLRAPGLATVDFSLAKTFHLGDDFKLEFRSEVFNLLNRANFDLPQRSVFASNGTVRPDAGRITATNTSSRQMQLAVKLIF